MFLLMTLCNCILYFEKKSGITEHYAHADQDDALTVAVSVVPPLAYKMWHQWSVSLL